MRCMYCLILLQLFVIIRFIVIFEKMTVQTRMGISSTEIGAGAEAEAGVAAETETVNEGAETETEEGRRGRRKLTQKKKFSM